MTAEIPMRDGAAPAMSCEQALTVVAECRTDNQIVISNQMTARIWPTFSRHPLDFNYLSSTMGGAIPLALGLAMARPEYEVIVLSGDGSLLMSLGCLATVIASGANNLTIILLENGLYEVTGRQRTPGQIAQLDYAGIARATGFPVSAAFDDVTVWREYSQGGWQSCGPRFFALRVQAVYAKTQRCTTTRVDTELQRLRESLCRS